VIPLEFLGLVKVPIGFPIAAGVKRPELQYRLGTSQAPACPRDSHPVFDQVTAGPFDDTGGDGEYLKRSKREQKGPDSEVSPQIKLSYQPVK
jgi:hypothetical protein